MKISGFAIASLFFASSLFAETAPQESAQNKILSISANPAAAAIVTGTGALGEALGIKPETGIRLGGLWIPDLSYLFTGGLEPKKWSGNNLAQLNLLIDTEKLMNLKGGLFSAEFLQFDGRETNKQAGLVQNYDGLPGLPPLSRSELYQLWYRQEFLNKRAYFRIGKIAASDTFSNVVRPVALQEEAAANVAIPASSGLIYTPLFTNSTMLNVLPSYYNSAYGLIASVKPIKSSYLMYGLFDGNLGKGRQTGLRGPKFNNYRFQIAETGLGWSLGEKELQGSFGIGGWDQSGKLVAISQSGSRTISEHGAQGLYLVGTQRLWRKNEAHDPTGIIGFGQYGATNSKTAPVTIYYGAGLTCFSLIPDRPKDSFGAGVAWAKLNQRIYERRHEAIIQGYYQFHLFSDVFFLSALSYIPKPGLSPHLSPAWAATARIIALF